MTDTPETTITSSPSLPPAPPEHLLPYPAIADRWHNLLAPYPWVWCDEIAIGLAVAYIDLALLQHRLSAALADDILLVTGAQGGQFANPLLAHARPSAVSVISALRAFEERVLTLAPSAYPKANGTQAWVNIPGAARGRTVIEHGTEPQMIDAQSAEADRRDRLLLGGRDGRGSRYARLKSKR